MSVNSSNGFIQSFLEEPLKTPRPPQAGEGAGAVTAQVYHSPHLFGGERLGRGRMNVRSKPLCHAARSCSIQKSQRNDLSLVFLDSVTGARNDEVEAIE